MESAVYIGSVRHRRYRPRAHAFRYRLFMVYLDLAELDRVFAGTWFWSARRWAPARFRREDHLGDPAQPLETAVRELVARETGQRPAGPIRLLTHLRYFGYAMNPVSVYYCYDASGARLETVVLEVNNTPWGEQYCYVLPAPAPPHAGAPAYAWDKAFHVSPFMTLDHQYRARIAAPARRLLLHIENWQDDARLFDATLTLHRRTITPRRLDLLLLRQPAMTVKVVAAIYFEALRLWWKRTPYVPHPSETPPKEEIGSA